ncbi:MAG: hypothetical protein AAF489_09460 [Bacteroidota bacterium]
MGKSFVLIMLSVALSFSMVAPALNSLLDFNPDYIAFNDFSEEEPNTGEKEIFEKDVVLVINQKLMPYSAIRCVALSSCYKEASSMFDEKILLPPPQHTS